MHRFLSFSWLISSQPSYPSGGAAAGIYETSAGNRREYRPHQMGVHLHAATTWLRLRLNSDVAPRHRVTRIRLHPDKTGISSAFCIGILKQRCLLALTGLRV